MLNFLRGLLLDVFAAIMFGVLAVCVMGILLALDWIWCTLIGWILRIPKV